MIIMLRITIMIVPNNVLLWEVHYFNMFGFIPVRQNFRNENQFADPKQLGFPTKTSNFERLYMKGWIAF